MGRALSEDTGPRIGRSGAAEEVPDQPLPGAPAGGGGAARPLNVSKEKIQLKSKNLAQVPL